jgi:BspA type Leucine rich repeat region (6 copies)
MKDGNMIPKTMTSLLTIPLAVLLLLATAAAVQAQFSYTTSDGAVTITGYNGPGGAVTIPSVINGLPVTSIGESAFANCTSLTSISIPASVISIGEEAFFYSGLTSATIPDSVTSIGYAAFGYCTSLTSATIGSGVTSIGDDAFDECTSLTNVTIPGGVASIGNEAFYDCWSLTSLTIPGSVTSIGNMAFAGCASLTSVTIPASVTSIGEYAFNSCTSLTSVTIGSGVTSIGEYAFYNCTRLSSVFFMGNAPAVDGTAFEVGYTTVYYLPGTTGWNVFAADTGIPALMLNPPPGTMVGDGFLIEISSGTSPLASYGYSILLIGDSDNLWNLIGIYNVQDDSGTYTYTNAGQYATVIMNDATETDNIRLTFTSPTQGAFFSDITYPPAYSGLTQSGNFVAATGTALNSIAGLNVLCSVTNGHAPFATSGTYTIVFAASGSTYVMKSSTGVRISSGKYTYSVVNRSTAAIQITDSVAGSFTVYVGFSDQLSGGYAITQASTGGFQIGSFSGTLPPVQTGALEATITPTGAITAGAQWRVDGGILLDSGVATDLPVGNHTISFNTVSGWTTPANQTVSIKANSVAKAKGAYTFSAQGIYNGLFMQADGTEETAGMLEGLDVTASGTYSGKLLIGGTTYGLNGGFNVSGQASNYVQRTAKQGGPLALEMTLNWNDSPPNITGTVSGTNGGAWVANLTNELAAKGSTSAEYTALVLPDGAPPGYGYILITNHAGAVTLSVTLADGTSFSQAVPLSGDGDLPVYGNLYGGSGLLLGWLGLEGGSPTGNLTWIKPASRSTALYTNGFTNLVMVQGSLWTNPLPHTAAIDLPSGQLDISGGSLPSLLSFNVAVSNNNALVKLPGSPTNSLTGSINAKTGLLTATFGNGAGKATTVAKGAVLQNVTNAAGFFLGKTNAGSIVLQP